MSSAPQPVRVAANLRHLLASEVPHSRQLKPLIWWRMQGQGVGPSEDPTTLLIDTVRRNHRPIVASAIREASVELLNENWTSPDAVALGELCSLVAAISATSAVDGLWRVLTRPDASTLQALPSETLRHRALRSLVALLLSQPQLALTPDLRELVYAQLSFSESRTLALAALIGLWPESADRVRAGNVKPDEHEAVNHLLHHCGFIPNP